MHQMLAVQVRVQLQVQVPALEGEVAAAQVVAVQEWALGSSLVVAREEQLALELVSSC
jgi:hypothetical protein